VSFSNASDHLCIMIDNLALRPVKTSGEEWLEEVARDTNLGEVLSKRKSTFSGAEALVVVTRALDQSESESVYVAKDRRTVAIRFDHKEPDSSPVRGVVATLEWLKPPPN
jgi:hypothetical protein